ncbi:hypothetical protein M231_05853 [Tremella mesenterica]|uniref:Peptidase S54 rhomboid domain-containing protein n=1 Tax=Tremella mesenterica TaxID=5217 RepID=A0A4Q1BH25_TREME|nr:hypothetical protein M231_05853 [Tremella mesenterica]
MSFRIPIGLSLSTLRPRPSIPTSFLAKSSRSIPLRHVSLLSRPPSIRPSNPHLLVPCLPRSLSSRPLSLPTQRYLSTSPSTRVRQTYFPRTPRPPPGFIRRFLRRLDSYPSIWIIYGIIGLNVGVFLLWQYAWQSYTQFRDPSLYLWMNRNFVMSEANIMAGRIWTLITSSFSHSSGQHIFINCLGLYFMAPLAASLIGSSAFIGLYLSGGVVAAITSLIWHRSVGVRDNKRWVGSEGASGAIYTSLAFYGALFPQTTFLFFFIVPMPAWVMLGGIFVYDLYSATYRPMSGTDSAAHVGGILAGLGAAWAVRRRGPGALRRW